MPDREYVPDEALHIVISAINEGAELVARPIDMANFAFSALSHHGELIKRSEAPGVSADFLFSQGTMPVHTRHAGILALRHTFGLDHSSVELIMPQDTDPASVWEADSDRLLAVFHDRQVKQRLSIPNVNIAAETLDPNSPVLKGLEDILMFLHTHIKTVTVPRKFHNLYGELSCVSPHNRYGIKPGGIYNLRTGRKY